MAYGTVPIVRATGGLADTVHHYQRPDGTGILFEDLTEAALVNALDQASQLFAEHPEQWERLRADPSLAAQAVEEVMRHGGAVSAIPRITVEDVELMEHLYTWLPPRMLGTADNG